MNQSDQHPERIDQSYEFDIPGGQQPVRIDAFLTNAIEHATRTKVQKSIDAGNVLVNGKPTKSNYKLRPHDKINVTVKKQPPIELIPEDIPLEVVYEDDHLMVVNKPTGMAVHPGIGNRTGTLVNAVLWHLGERNARTIADDFESSEDPSDDLGSNEEEILRSNAIRPGIVHRLDKNTSGLILVAKNEVVAQQLSDQFADRTVSRSYLALCWGVFREDERMIEGNIGRSSKDRKLMAVVTRGGKSAITDVTCIERYDCASLVRCTLRTGRTHQIRVHMSHVRHPIVGDESYGGGATIMKAIHTLFRGDAKKALMAINRQALHAQTLSFHHPVKNEEMSFTAPVPDDLLASIRAVRPIEFGDEPPELST